MCEYLGDTGIELYDLVNLFSGIILLIYNFSHLKYKKEFLSNVSNRLLKVFSNKKNHIFLSNKNFYAFVEILIVSLLQYLPTYNITRIFGHLVGTGANYFGLVFFIPIFLFLLFYLLGINPFKQMDLITPAYPLALTISKIACFCAGCCRGVEWSSGLYNHYTDRVEFPVQLLESGLALLIFIFFMFWKKHAKEGTLFPTYLIIYGATRFFSEFTRSEPDIIWHLKTYHILCIISVIVGLVELLVVLKFGEKIKSFYTTNFIIKALDEHIEKIEKKMKHKKTGHKKHQKKAHHKHKKK